MVGVLALAGATLVFLSHVTESPVEELKVQIFALLLYVASAGIWLLTGWRPRVGRWATVVVLIAIVCLGNGWLSIPGFLVLLPVPIVLALPLIDLAAAAVTACCEAALLLLLPPAVVPEMTTATTVTALAAISATFAVVYLIYRREHQLVTWLNEYLESAQGSLEEARDRRAELMQALEDLEHANVQLTRLNILAQGLRQAADDARTAKEQFVANVSHELRTPLNMVTGFSEMILQAPDMYGGKLPPALLADLAVIHRNATHLAELIDDVLDLSQIEADQMGLVKEHVCFLDIVEAATEAVRPLFDSKGLYLEAEMPGDMPPVFCDPTRIREVLLNLLSNAGRFTDRGGVHVRVWQEGNDIVTAVADTGPGIAAEDIDRIFRPFHQVDGSTRRRYGGTGLGLAISKRFVELHGGEIWVESREGVGTEFFFRLPSMPLAPMNGSSWRRIQPDWEYLERPQPPTAREPSIRPRYIVLEPEGSLGRILTRYLDEVEIVQVETIQEALEELERTPAWALLINTSSIGKAVGDMQQRPPLPAGTPAIICSMPGVHETSTELGASDRLIKPVSQEALLRALDRLDLKSGTVLIIDDEPDALHLFGRMLALSGRNYRVLLARDGREALDVLREESPDVLLLDLIMPNMDGFQLLEIRNQDPVLRNIPVVVISARDPIGQPIVSNALSITRAGGLSVRQVLDTIQFVSRTLSVSGQSGGSTPRGARID